MMQLSTHVIDSAQGCPAAGLEVALAFLQADGTWLDLGSGPTDENGRIERLLPRSFPLRAGAYRLSYGTNHYFQFSAMQGVYPLIPLVIEVDASGRSVHVVLTLARYGYSTHVEYGGNDAPH